MLTILATFLPVQAEELASTPQQEVAVTIENAFIRGLPPTQPNTAAFFTVVNHSDEEVTLLAAGSDIAEALEIHRHEHHNGMMSMQEQPSVTIAPHSSFQFAPGGYHLMLLNLRRPLREGEQVQFNLKTCTGDLITVNAPVVSVLNETGLTKGSAGSHLQ